MLSPIFCIRENRVVLNGLHLSRTNVEARVPQGSILGPLWLDFKSEIICG